MASLAGYDSDRRDLAYSGKAERDHFGSIVCWRNVANGAEYSTHEEGQMSAAVLSSIARLAQRGLDLRQWRCQSVSTPQSIFRDVRVTRKAKSLRPHPYEGKKALTILSEAGRGKR